MNSRKNSKQAADNKPLNDDTEMKTNGSDTEFDHQCDANMSECEICDGDISAEMTEPKESQVDWQDKYVRLSAEFDNYRKRTLKEKMDLVSMGGEDVIKSMLPVLDDMDRALEAMSGSQDIEAVRSGIELISHKTRETLKHRGLNEIEALGEQFDTDFHEALAKIPTEAEYKGRVVEVIQRGYALKDRVLRHAKVVVGE